MSTKLQLLFNFLLEKSNCTRKLGYFLVHFDNSFTQYKATAAQFVTAENPNGLLLFIEGKDQNPLRDTQLVYFAQDPHPSLQHYGTSCRRIDGQTWSLAEDDGTITGINISSDDSLLQECKEFLKNATSS